MHPMRIGLAVILGGLMVGSTAFAQLPINPPTEWTTPYPTYGAAPGTTLGTPDQTVIVVPPNANVVITQPGLPPPTTGSAPVTGAGVPAAGDTPLKDDSRVSVIHDGMRLRSKTFAEYGAVRSFDSGGLLTFQDGTEITFPANFAFLSTPEPGQPVTAYYFKDQDGNNVLYTLDMGKDGGTGADSGGG